MHIKRNDNVMIIAGKDKGKTGKVVQVFPEKQRVVVEGQNTLTKHMARRGDKEPGQKIEFSAPMHASNVKLVCPKCTKGTRVGMKVMKDASSGDKTKGRVCKKCNEVIE